jgi:hypothetical protein
VKRALQLAEYVIVGALVLAGTGMAFWNAGKWLLGL